MAIVPRIQLVMELNTIVYCLWGKYWDESRSMEPEKLR